MVDYMTDFEVVWHGALQNDPLGGRSKGCLLEPRAQTEDERIKSETFDDLGLTQKELVEAVERLNASLRQPVKYGAFGG